MTLIRLKFKILVLVFLLSNSLSAQDYDEKRISSLIDSINNDDLVGTCKYVWTIELDKEARAAMELIEIGRLVSNDLIDALSNPRKGIIAHYILSKTWFERMGISSEYRATSEVAFTMNELQFIQGSNEFIVESSELTDRQIYWKFYLRNKLGDH
ncbi:MAG: hypothetical protein RIF33_06750 [Cyclobacteriaceae bacterium]